MSSKPARLRTARPRVYFWPGSLRSRIDLSPFVTAVTSTKGLSGPSGTWSLTLSSSGASVSGAATELSAVYASIRPNTLVSIGHERDGGWMLGLVDQVSRAISLSGSRVNHTISVTGRDLGKALECDSITHTLLASGQAGDYDEKIKRVLGRDTPLLWLFPEASTWRGDRPLFFGGTIAEIADFALRHTPSMTLPILHEILGTRVVGQLPATAAMAVQRAQIRANTQTDYTGPGTVGDLIRPVVTTWNDGRVFSPGMVSFQGSIWGYLTQVLDLDFYEAWVDCLPPTPDKPFGEPQLIIRPKPFTDPLLDWLPTSATPDDATRSNLRTMVTGASAHVLESDETMGVNLSRSEADVFSVYAVSSTFEFLPSDLQDLGGFAFPAIDLFAAARYGIRHYRTRVTLASAPMVDLQSQLDQDARDGQAPTPDAHQKAYGDVLSLAVDFRNRLVNWYRLSPWMESGSIQIFGTDDIRPGDPVTIPWLQPATGGEVGVQGYVTSVTQAWSFGGPHVTTLQVSRLYNRSLVMAARSEIASFANLSGMPGDDMLAVPGLFPGGAP